MGDREGVMSLFKGFKLNGYLTEKPALNDDEYYKYACDTLAAYLLIEDTIPSLDVVETSFSCPNGLLWLNRGEIIAGSSVMSTVAKATFGADLVSNDIDIYFKSKDDAVAWAYLNKFMTPKFDPQVAFENPICTYGFIGDSKINLIYGIPYASTKDLISRFDIRACSMALDFNNNTLYSVKGALSDIGNKAIKFNPVPRSVTIKRLVKYVEKGFKINSNQRLFFVELLKTNLYSAELDSFKNY